MQQLLFAAVIAILAAAFYSYTGNRLRRRPVSAEFRWASLAFSSWWLCLALTTFIGALQIAMVYLGNRDLDLYLTLLYVNLLIICVGLWGLVYYLIFLFTGKHTHFPYLTAFYVGYFALLLYYIQVQGPSGIDIETWAVRPHYDAEITGGPLLIVVALLVFPQIIAAIAYLSLLPSLQDRSQKYRVLVVSLAIIIWFGSAFIVSATNNQKNDAWQIASRLIGLAAACATLFAYEPPRFVQRLLHVHPVDVEPSRPAHAQT